MESEDGTGVEQMKTMQLEPAPDRTREFFSEQWPGHACCCTAPPVVKVVMPPSELRDHHVELFLCGQHYRASMAAPVHCLVLRYAIRNCRATRVRPGNDVH